MLIQITVFHLLRNALLMILRCIRYTHTHTLICIYYGIIQGITLSQLWPVEISLVLIKQHSSLRAENCQHGADNMFSANAWAVFRMLDTPKATCKFAIHLLGAIYSITYSVMTNHDRKNNIGNTKVFYS